MADKVSLHELLAIYFDLTDRPKGKQLVMGELSLDDYVSDTIASCTKRIDKIKWDIVNNPSLAASSERILKKLNARLEKALYWKDRGYGV